MTSDQEQWAYRFARLVLRPTMTGLTRRHWWGAEHLPRTGGCVVVCNHISHSDPLTIAHFLNDNGRAPRFLGKAEIFGVPVIGRIVKDAGQIPVYRETVDAAKALRDAVAAVERGECVVVYPEATLTRDPNLWPMVGKTGAARVALMTRCPVIPIAQWGPQELLPPYTKRPHVFPRTDITIRVGAPVDLSRFSEAALTGDVLREATAEIMSAITRLLEQIRGSQAPERPYDPRDHGVRRTGDPHQKDEGVEKGQ